MIGLFAGTMLMLTGCATTEPTTTETDAFTRAVDNIFRTWGETNLNPDLEGFMSIWDENAVKMAAGRPTAVGAAGIRGMKQKAFGTTIYAKFEIKVDEYQLAGGFGWARGIYTIVSQQKTGGDPLTDVGTFLTVFKKQSDGSWKVYRDTMMPLPK
jgi:ketosteroid isomerase-like protein